MYQIADPSHSRTHVRRESKLPLGGGFCLNHSKTTSMRASPTCRPPVCQVRRGLLPKLDAINAACRSPLAQAFRSPGTGAVRLTPRRLASATSYQPRVSGNGHTSAGANPLLHPAQPDAAPNVGPQPAVPFAVQTPPSSGDIVIHNAVPEQQKAISRSVTAAEASPPQQGSSSTAADEKPPVNSWILFVEERYVAEMNRLSAGRRGRKSVMGVLSDLWNGSSETRAKYSARQRELKRAYEQRHQAAAAEPAPKKPRQRRAAAGPSAAEERMAEMEARLREVRADYRRLGDDVAFQQEQLWNQAGVLRAAVNEDVTCRLQQLTAENGRLWLFAITQHQNALANAQALRVAQLQLEVRSLRVLVAAAEEAQRPRGGVRMAFAWVTALAGVLLTGLLIVAALPGASSALKAGVAASSQLLQPFAAPALLIIGAVLAAAAIAQGCAAALAALKADG